MEKEITDKTTSAEMRNVTLSNATKEFLVAHRMIQEAGDHVLEQVTNVWGDSDDGCTASEMTAFWDAMGKMQNETLRLMVDVIDGNLATIKVTEV